MMLGLATFGAGMLLATGGTFWLYVKTLSLMGPAGFLDAGRHWFSFRVPYAFIVLGMVLIGLGAGMAIGEAF